jgi:PIN like domain
MWPPMRSEFPGYFTPTEEEFTKLWSERVFAFDANVLLGLYRSTGETQKTFFAVLDKIADRIFLPHQAAAEYLRNRLDAISFRSQQYARIKAESDKLANTVEPIVQEQAVLNGEEIARTAKDFAEKIGELAGASADKEPDLLRSDSILSKLAKLFDAATGQPYPPEAKRNLQPGRPAIRADDPTRI